MHSSYACIKIYNCGESLCCCVLKYWYTHYSIKMYLQEDHCAEETPMDIGGDTSVLSKVRTILLRSFDLNLHITLHCITASITFLAMYLCLWQRLQRCIPWLRWCNYPHTSFSTFSSIYLCCRHRYRHIDNDAHTFLMKKKKWKKSYRMKKFLFPVLQSINQSIYLSIALDEPYILGSSFSGWSYF